MRAAVRVVPSQAIAHYCDDLMIRQGESKSIAHCFFCDDTLVTAGKKIWRQ